MEIKYLYLAIINILIIVLYFQVLKYRGLEELAKSIISITDVEYSFVVKKIRENATTVTLYGLGGIEVRISKEEFELQKVEVGKLWAYDGNDYFCYDPNFNYDVNKGVF